MVKSFLYFIVNKITKITKNITNFAKLIHIEKMKKKRYNVVMVNPLYQILFHFYCKAVEK